MADIEIGVNVTNTRLSTESPEFKLGTTASVSDSLGVCRDYIYVKFNEAPTAIGYVELLNPLTNTVTMVTSTNALAAIGYPIGVAVSVPSAGGFGWVQIYGPGLVRTSAAVVLGGQLNTTATPGALDDTLTAATTAQIAGIANTAVAGAAATVTSWLNYPFVSKAQQ